MGFIYQYNIVPPPVGRKTLVSKKSVQVCYVFLFKDELYIRISGTEHSK